MGTMVGSCKNVVANIMILPEGVVFTTNINDATLSGRICNKHH